MAQAAASEGTAQAPAGFLRAQANKKMRVWVVQYFSAQSQVWPLLLGVDLQALGLSCLMGTLFAWRPRVSQIITV